MSEIDIDEVMARGERAFEVATDEAKALDEQFIANLAQSGAGLSRVVVCQAMALFVLRTAKDGYIATHGDNGPTIEVGQIPFAASLPDVAEALRTAADLLDAMNSAKVTRQRPN